MRRIGAASLATVNPMAQPARDLAAKDGNVTEMFAETIQLPACVAPAAAEAVPTMPEPERACRTWHARMTRAIASRFRRAPRAEERQGPDSRLERFQTRRSGPGPSS